MTVERIVLALAFGALIAGATYLLSAMKISGAIASFFAVAASLIFGDFPCFCLLLFAFSAITVAGKLVKRHTPSAILEKSEKEGARDAMQVIANGGAATVTAVLLFLTKEPFFIAAYAVAVGEALSDSLASEIGALSPRSPRSILTGKPVEPGTSGGISLLGTLAAAGGSLVTAAFSLIFLPFSVEFFLGILIFSLFGVFLDSFLGATVQAKRRCIHCGKSTEKRRHCGDATATVGGVAFFGNDLVNLMSNAAATALAVLFFAFF